MRIDTGQIPTPANTGPFSIAFSTKEDGNMERVQAKRQEAQANRDSFLSKIQFPDEAAIYRIRPSHTPNIEHVASHGRGLLRDVVFGKYMIETDFDFYDHAADGIVTGDKSAGVMLISGDCTPLVIWEELSLVYGILHVGLLGALNGTVKTLRNILDKLQVDPALVRAYLGPSISFENYDVTKSGLWRAIEGQAQANPLLEATLAKHFSGTHFDVRGAIVGQLLTIGVRDANIQVFDACTAGESSKFFSHYAAKQKGEEAKGFASVIWARQ
jgi:copper oxidase (laccase) domain-containing protein